MLFAGFLYTLAVVFALFLADAICDELEQDYPVVEFSTPIIVPNANVIRIVSEWLAQDVQQVRPDLSCQQASVVLKEAEAQWIKGHSVTFDLLEEIADRLFPVEEHVDDLSDVLPSPWSEESFSTSDVFPVQYANCAINEPQQLTVAVEQETNPVELQDLNIRQLKAIASDLSKQGHVIPGGFSRLKKEELIAALQSFPSELVKKSFLTTT